ncbi:ankyrin repeat-containing domain protein [Aspergillus karnatakaensis]|uniref:ankyrin repeat domain-containing protein n=1 Tax=Aspergillus karnatakaensis TaxID=1810916 RepID=UPI003CCCD27C
MSFGNIPNNILLDVINHHIDSQSDLYALIRTSRRLYFLEKPYLYLKNIRHGEGTAIHWAIKLGERKTIIYAHGTGQGDVNGECGPRRERPLMLATKWSHDDIVRELLDRGANVNVTHNGISSPLHEACLTGEGRKVDMLLEYSTTNAGFKETYGRTALMAACEMGHLDIVMKLLSRNDVDINHESSSGKTALTFYSLFPEWTQTWERDGGGSGPLAMESGEGAEECVRLLLDMPGIDISGRAVHRLGTSPLQNAVQRNHVKIAQILLEHGVDVNERLWLGRTVLFEACADLSIEDDGRWTPIHTAAKEGCDAAVRILLEDGRVNPDKRGSRTSASEDGCRRHVQELDGRTPLMVAASNGYERKVSLLLADPRVQINIQTPGTRLSALGYAASQGHVNVVKILIRHPAIDEDICTWDGMITRITAKGGAECNAEAIIDMFRNSGRLAGAVEGASQQPEKPTIQPNMDPEHTENARITFKPYLLAF